MAIGAAQQPSTTLDPAEMRRALERILTSKYFANAHKKQKFLRVICDFYLEGRAGELNEYVLGYDVFGRDRSYNPAADPIVRVVAHEIRKKLEVYYQTEGVDDPIRLEMPAGSYQPVFSRHEPNSNVDVADPVVATISLARAEREKPRILQRPSVPGVAVIVLTLAVVVLAAWNVYLRQQLVSATEPIDPATYGPLWEPFLKDSTPPVVVLSNPSIFRVSNASDPESALKESILLRPEDSAALRDKVVTNPRVMVGESTGTPYDAGTNQSAAAVVKESQTPRLILSNDVYTGMGESFGLHHLTQFFAGGNRYVLLKQSRTLSTEDLKSHNVILLGGGWVNEWSGKLPQSEHLKYTNRSTIENHNQKPGEEFEYIPVHDKRTGNLSVDYAMITVKPNISDAYRVMVLSGINSPGTQAAAEFVTQKNYLDQLNRYLKEAAGTGQPPQYFQVLLKVAVEHGSPVAVSVLTFHELRREK